MASTVAKRTKASAHMVDASLKGMTLMGGTTAMQAAGETYLPRFKAEEVEDYQSRLKMTWLFNGYRSTVRDMTGKVFDKPVEIVDAPENVVEWMENADMQGRDLSTFAAEVFKDGLSGSGVSYIMVEAPRREGEVTLAQAQEQNLRPYLVHITVKELLGWRSEAVNNVTTLTMVRLMETVTERDPEDEFNDIEIEQVRVIDLDETGFVRVRLYRQKNEQAEWLEVEQYTTGVQQIMIAPFYANRTGFMTGEPLLDDLADVNIAHWQSQSDQRNSLHFARIPILFAAGFLDEESLVIASSKAVKVVNDQAKLEWVEHSGKALDAGRQDLKDLEFQMETFGLQLLVARDGAQSATGEALDAAKETSQLAMIADSLQDALEQAVQWMYQLAGLPSDNVSVRVSKDFGVSMMTAQELTVLLTAVNTGNMSRTTLLQELARRGMVRADLDVDAELEAIQAEGGSLVDDMGDDT